MEFSIFGDQTPVIGELFKMPTVAPYPEIRAALEQLPGVESVTSLVSGLALLEYGNYRVPAPLFGVEPDTYLRTLPGIQVQEGRFLQSGERGVVLPEGRVKQIEASIGQKLSLGALIQFSVADGITFRIRSAPLVGIIQYPLRNETLDSIVLVDPTTVRELYNYLISSATPSSSGSLAPSLSGSSAPGSSTAAPSAPTPYTAGSSSADSLDALFEEAEPDRQAAAKGIEREAIEKELAEALKAPRPAVDEGAWNFLLVRVAPPTGAGGSVRNRGMDITATRGTDKPGTPGMAGVEAADSKGILNPEGIRNPDPTSTPSGAEVPGRSVASRLVGSAAVLQVQRELKRLVQEKGWEVEVLDWRKTAGTSALFLYWMRMIFNIGFFVVAIASLIILIDTLIMSVLERVPEIGTSGPWELPHR